MTNLSQELTRLLDGWDAGKTSIDQLAGFMLKHRDALKEALADAWQPIETASKVRGQLILSFNRYGVFDTICWNDSTQWWDDGLYREGEDGPNYYPEPKYWRPLLEPPAGRLPESFNVAEEE